MKIYNSNTDLQKLINDNPIFIIQYGSATCAPCFALKERLDRWVEKYDCADCIYISVDDFPNIAADESIFSVPTILVYADGKVTLRESGYFSLDIMLEKVERYIELFGDIENH